jgi:tetratricopeptide (TPR) repeat protein
MGCKTFALLLEIKYIYRAHPCCLLKKGRGWVFYWEVYSIYIYIRWAQYADKIYTIMRPLIIISVLLLLALKTNGQTTQRERKAVQVMTPQTFYLNGGTRATFGGKSRTWFNIQLPPNTVEWYYSFSTSKNENSTTSIGLLSQLANLIDPSGLTSIATSSIFTPTGAGVCDIYLMDRKNADAFMEKVDNFGGSYSYFVTGSRENFKDGTIQINDIKSGILCLGFKNPSASEGIFITFEVVAIVEETKLVQKSEREQKAETFGTLGWRAYEKGEYDKCIELSKKALEFNPDMGWVHNNIGLVLLIKGDYISAIDSYSNAILLFKKTDRPKYYFNEAIKDLNNLIGKHGQVEGVTDILEMLKTEQGK